LKHFPPHLNAIVLFADWRLCQLNRSRFGIQSDIIRLRSLCFWWECGCYILLPFDYSSTFI